MVSQTAAGTYKKKAGMEGSGVTSARDVLKKRRAAERQPLGDWARVGIGALIAAVGVVLLATVFRPPRLEEHTHYQEALKVLRNDGLEGTDANVRLRLQAFDAATSGYSERVFRIVDANEWPPRCRSNPKGICRRKPDASEVKQDAEGYNMSLLELEGVRAKVWLIEDFISEAEAEKLLEKAGKMEFKASPTNHASGQDWRSSSTSFADRSDPDFGALARRAAAVCGVPASFVEVPQVVRYLPGERYQPHLDSEGAEHRHHTLLVYLNDPGGGGATAFPLLGMKVLPSARAAVFWENLHPLEDGRKVRNFHTLHDGQAPTGAEPKFALNLWVRNEVYEP